MKVRGGQGGREERSQGPGRQTLPGLLGQTEVEINLWFKARSGFKAV